jgi:hypothetical protein
MSDRFHQGLAESGEQPREGNRSAFFGPRDPVHPDPKLAGGGERDANKLNFEVFVPFIILDRNSQVCFHKLMVSAGLKKSPVHEAVHAVRPNTC